MSSDTPQVIALDAPLSINAAAGEGETKKPRRFEMLAYAGGAIEVSAYPLPVVVDLAGMSLRTDQIPTYLGHHSGEDASRLVGHVDQHDVGSGRLVVAGAISAANDMAREVVESHDNGYQWQASVGVHPVRADLERVPAGQTVTANGQQFTGPLLVARKSVLRHIAILPEGADKNTKLSIAATAAQRSPMDVRSWTSTFLDPVVMTTTEESDFGDWLHAAFGGDVPELADRQKGALIEMFQQASRDAPLIAADAGRFDANSLTDLHDKHLATLAASAAKCDGKIAANVLDGILAEAKSHAADLFSRAIDEERPAPWLLAQLGRAEAVANVKMIRASRPKAPLIYGSSRDQNMNPEIITAALCLNSGVQEPESLFPENVLDAAGSKQFRNFGLQQLLVASAAENGRQTSPGERIHRGNLREILQYALPSAPIHASAVSTIDVAGILSNTGNKMLLDGFHTTPQKWREVATVRPVNDFKEATAYRMTANLEYEELAPAGEIKHGTLGEESYSMQARTYAKMLSLTRTDIINDDLGAFDDLRTRLGVGAAAKMNRVFWTLWVNNTKFFTAARGNYQEGADTALGEAGLNSAVKLFREMQTPDGTSLDLEPAVLLVPSDLEATARKWHKSTEIRDTTASTKTPIANIYEGLFKPVAVPQLGHSDYTGSSALAWYLLADPKILATATMCFLNGQESPTIEAADADFNQLGIQLRGYHDFGVAMTEYRAGVKSKGEA